MNALGTHLLIELKECNPEILKSLEKVRSIMVSAAKEAKATIIDISFREFNPFGISGLIVIAESHLTIHTWPGKPPHVPCIRSNPYSPLRLTQIIP